MTLQEARALTEYWQDCPPENELLTLLTQAFTTWKPGKPLTEEEMIVEHRKSLQRRWDAGALNARDIVRMGGAIQGAQG